MFLKTKFIFINFKQLKCIFIACCKTNRSQPCGFMFFIFIFFKFFFHYFLKKNFFYFFKDFTYFCLF